MGWQGALHHNEWMVPLAAVVRSWEDRFGARVVGRRLQHPGAERGRAAGRPRSTRCTSRPSTGRSAPTTSSRAPGNLMDYAEQIMGGHAWSFWWD